MGASGPSASAGEAISSMRTRRRRSSSWPLRRKSIFFAGPEWEGRGAAPGAPPHRVNSAVGGLKLHFGRTTRHATQLSIVFNAKAQRHKGAKEEVYRSRKQSLICHFALLRLSVVALKR